VVEVTLKEGTKPFAAPPATANRFVQGLADAKRHDPPGAVFCSRELERELSEFVCGEVAGKGVSGFPSEEAIRERARGFLGVERTPADDAVLLGRFVEVMRGRLGLGPSGEQQQGQMGLAEGGLASGGMDFSAVALDTELSDVLGQMDFDFGDMGDFMGIATGGMPMDQL
jgi:hypothetical protein